MSATLTFLDAIFPAAPVQPPADTCRYAKFRGSAPIATVSMAEPRIHKAESPRGDRAFSLGRPRGLLRVSHRGQDRETQHKRAGSCAVHYGCFVHATAGVLGVRDSTHVSETGVLLNEAVGLTSVCSSNTNRMVLDTRAQNE